MENNSTELFQFSSLKGKEVSAIFDEPDVTSDAGLLLVREVEKRVGIIRRLCAAITEGRRKGSITHGIGSLCSQRIYQIIAGYEDANDCDALRADPALKVAVGLAPLGDEHLASQPTMSRFENAVTTRDLLSIGYVFVEQFIASYSQPPEAIVIDMDPTADIVYGEQQLRLFNAHEDEYCFMPFHVYEGITGKLITTVLRPGKTPTAEEIISILKRLDRRLRAAWPKTVIIFRGDSHHTKPAVMRWMEQRGWHYVTGLSGNANLERLAADVIEQASTAHQATGAPARRFGVLRYAAKSWDDMQRRVICRVEATERGVDVRYIVTSFENASARYLYENVYCGRGAMELMIKDHKNGLKSDRTSCHTKEANQLRLFLHSAAYVLLHALRSMFLKGTELARSQFDTLRLKLLKIGARVTVKKTRIQFHLPESYPLQDVYRGLVKALAAANSS